MPGKFIEKGKRVAVLGIGVSGYESARFLKSKGYQVFASDSQDSAAVRDRAARLERNGVEVEYGKHTETKILNSDWIIVSPGILPSSGIMNKIKENGIPVYSEIEAASWFCPTDKIIAVTGTCGKTTLTTLIQRLFEQSGKKSVLCGNIGNPWISEINKLRDGDFVVLEVSSFQLWNTKSFRPRIAVLTNLSANHEDWHRDFEEYSRAKFKIFENQTKQGTAILRRSDKEAFYRDRVFRADTVFYDEEQNDNPHEAILGIIAKIAGVETNRVKEVTSRFEGIEHRLEKVAEEDGVVYVNDSKCTTTASLDWALSKYEDKSVLLIAGGHPKSRDFSDVRGKIKQKVKNLILIGEAAELLKKEWAGTSEVTIQRDLKAAVAYAHANARPGNVVLLSPACASFDMFENYIHRGRVFKEIVCQLTASRHSSQGA